MKVPRSIAVAALVCLAFATGALAQRTKTTKRTASNAGCAIGETRFRCPDGFVSEGAIDSKTKLFRGSGEGARLRVFVSMPLEGFDETLVRAKVARSLVPESTKEFEWRTMEPLLMNIESKFESESATALGFDGSTIVNFIRREFRFGEKRIVVGYGYVFRTAATQKEFNEALGGDNAVGCNEIATILNSITREHKDARQYCFLTGLRVGSLE